MKLGGKDIRELHVDDLYGAIATVSQDAFAFHDTVEDNIRFGNPDAKMHAVEQALVMPTLSSLKNYLMALKPSLVNEVFGYQVGNVNDSQSPAHYCATRLCWFWTKPYQRWMPVTRLRSSGRWTDSWRANHARSLRTDCRA